MQEYSYGARRPPSASLAFPNSNKSWNDRSQDSTIESSTEYGRAKLGSVEAPVEEGNY